MLPGMNPKMLQKAMKQMGVKEKEIDALEVLIKTSSGDLVIRDPVVKEIEMMGQKSLQVVGTIEEVSGISDEDVATVASQADVLKMKLVRLLNDVMVTLLKPSLIYNND